MQDKAQRSRPPDGVVPYVEPLSRINDALCRLLDERYKISMNRVHSRSGARQGAIAPLAEPRKQALLRMHRRKQGEGVVSLRRAAFEEQRRIVPLIG